MAVWWKFQLASVTTHETKQANYASVTLNAEQTKIVFHFWNGIKREGVRRGKAKEATHTNEHLILALMKPEEFNAL